MKKPNAIELRPATCADTADLVRLIDIASEGVLPQVWSAMAPEGVSPEAFGMELVRAETGDFSFRHAILAERGGAVAAAMIGYPLPATPDPESEDVPEMFAGVVELAASAPGHWYINIIATFPDARRSGLGRALLDAAETAGRRAGCPGIALIVAASNAGAQAFYAAAGFREIARRPFDLTALGHAPTEAILLVKEFG
ncbi:MAG: GNAT family N-acetyltransferase [Paracoccaceae bacterium]|nr:GNAT family N-acetyltransferase [Paracoccaceae bacterium]